MNSARWFAYLSGAVAIVQLVLLAIFFARGEPYGSLNDAAIVVQYLLALPLVLALHGLLPRRGPANLIALLLGLTGIAAITVLQALLLAQVLTFDQQVGPVTAALYLLFGGWLLLTGYLARGVPALRRAMLMSFLGWTYIGFPIWAFWLGGRLRTVTRAA